MSESEKKILILSYYWPPSGGPGALRMVGWTKYLVRAGWQPVVLTVKEGEFPYLDPDLSETVPESVPVLRVGAPNPFAFYKFLTGRKSGEALPVGLLTFEKKSLSERIAAWVRANLFIPDGRVGWVRPATRAALRIIREQNIRNVLISSPPHSSQLIGLRLKDKIPILWIADLRDPWTEIRYYQSARRTRLAEARDGRYERAVLDRADYVTTVSRALASDFQERGGTSRKISVLMNGFDPDDFAATPSDSSKKFRIVHTGNMLENQNPAVLWESLRKLAGDDRDFKSRLEIRLTGRVHPAVEKTARGAGFFDALILDPFRPHREILPEIQGAALLLVVIPRTEANAGIVTGKLLEYIGSGRPILVIGPPDGDAAQIVRPLSNAKAVDYDDAAGCLAFIQNIFEEWKENDLPISQTKERAPFSRAVTVKKLIDLIRSSES